MAPPRHAGQHEGLLARETYDDDASTLRNLSSEDDVDEVILRGPSQEHEEEDRRMFDSLDDDDLVVHHSEVQVNDLDVLESEDEREKLLSRDKKNGLFGSLGRKSGRKVLVGSMRGEYEMEEGMKPRTRGKKGGVKVYDFDERQSRRPTLCKLGLFALGLSVILVALIGGALHFTPSGSAFSKSILSNGTHDFHPTTILISLDGFRADFLLRNISPTLQAFIDNGVSPAYMLPSFPSVTFPNHYTIVTGMYPESHGVVGNSFWDPILKQEFFYTDPARSMQPFWWGGEPIWVTAEKQGVKSGIHMWPGSEAHIAYTEPTYLDPFNKSETLDRKVDRMLEWIDKPLSERPQFIASYVPHIDVYGHKYGPNSTEVNDTIALVDDMLENLFIEISNRNLTNLINIIVVSDHGMATTSNDRLIYLEDIIDTELIEHVDGWPLYGLRPYDTVNISDLHATLVSESAKDPHWEVYLRDEDMPERYHFSNNPRIAPLWMVPETGYAIVTREEHDPATNGGQPYKPRGLHGYDNLNPLMRAIFVARGPAFPHPPGTRVEPFGNWEVYSILCHSLGLTEGLTGNNGTMGWSTGGGFTFAQKAQIEDAHDLPVTSSWPIPSPPVTAGPSTSSASTKTMMDTIVSSAKVQVNEPIATPARPTRPTKPKTSTSPTTTSPSFTSPSSTSPTSSTPPTETEDAGSVSIATAPATPPPATGSQTDGKQEGTPADQDPSKMNWLEYTKWRADRMKEKIKDFWNKLWDGDEGSDKQ